MLIQFHHIVDAKRDSMVGYKKLSIWVILDCTKKQSETDCYRHDEGGIFLHLNQLANQYDAKCSPFDNLFDGFPCDCCCACERHYIKHGCPICDGRYNEKKRIKI